MMYTNGKVANYPGQYVNPADFYNYLDYLNLGGLVKAYTGTDSDDTLGIASNRFHSDLYDENTRQFDFNPYETEYKGYDLRTKDGDLYDQYEEGEFTTSKIEKDRKKSEGLHSDVEDYLYDESLGTKANWMDPDIKEGDNPLANKKWSLHNTTADTMYYDKYNPTKLYSEEDWTKKGDEDLVNRSIDMLNIRHKQNPDLFQEVTGYDPKTKNITYAGEKLKGDLSADNVSGTGYLAFGKKEGEDDFNFMGSLLEDDKGSIEGKKTAFNPVTDTEGNIKDIKREDQMYSFSPAQIGFEIDKPYPSARSQMDVPRPLNTLSKFPKGSEVDWESIYQKRGDMYKDMNLEDYKTEAIRQQGLYDQHGKWDYRSADEYGKHKQLQDLLGVSSQEVWDERMAPEGERMYDTLSGFEKNYVKNNLGVTEDELMSYYTHPDLSQRSAPPQNISAAEYADMSPIQQKAFQDATGITDTKQNIQDDSDMTDEEIDEWWSSLSSAERQELQYPGQSSFGPRYAHGKGENSWGTVGDFLYSATLAPLSHGLDLISMPVNLIAEGIEGLAGTGDGQFNASGIVPAFRGDFSFDTLHGEGKQISNLIGMEDAHWLPKLGVDILTDPVTYATFGLAGGLKGAASSGTKAFSREGAKAFAKNAARKYGPTAGKVAAGSLAAGIAAPHVFGSDPSKIDEMNELYAEDYDGQPSGGWNPYPYGENIDPNVMLAQYGGGLPTFAEAGEYSYRLDEDGNYQPQTTMMEDISESSELCSCDANIPASDVAKCQEACAKQEEVTEVDEVEEEEEKEDNRNFEKGYEAVMQGMGLFNQISESRPEDFSNNQLAMNQFQTDSRDNRGMTDVNTGMQFQDKRVRARQGKAGTEMIDLNLPPVYTGPKYNLGMFTEKRNVDPWVNVRNSGMNLSRNFPIGDSNVSLTPRIGFTNQRFMSDDLPQEVLNQYFSSTTNPNLGLSLKYNFDEGGRTQQLRNRQYDDGDQHLNDLELDEDTIQELIAMGAEIDYI